MPVSSGLFNHTDEIKLSFLFLGAPGRSGGPSTSGKEAVPVSTSSATNVSIENGDGSLSEPPETLSSSQPCRYRPIRPRQPDASSVPPTTAGPTIEAATTVIYSIFSDLPGIPGDWSDSE
jgi:hypothetical protein